MYESFFFFLNTFLVEYKFQVFEPLVYYIEM